MDVHTYKTNLSKKTDRVKLEFTLMRKRVEQSFSFKGQLQSTDNYLITKRRTERENYQSMPAAFSRERKTRCVVSYLILKSAL